MFCTQVTGYPRLCNSTFIGTIRKKSDPSGTKVDYVQKNIASSQDEQSVIVNYTVSNIDPQMNYIFIVDLLNHLNHSKTRNMLYFSEWIKY